MKNHDRSKRKSGKVNRRQFMAGIGAVGAATALHPVRSLALAAEPQRTASTSGQGDTFTRMFNLPSFAEPTEAVRNALRALGAPGGIMDAKDPLQEGPIRLITMPELSPNNRDNVTHTAGLTFLGQFLDHDLTFDTTSPLGVPTDP